VASSKLDDMLPAMFGNATLAIEVSRTSKIVASMTAMAIHHGLTLGVQTAVSAVGEAVCDMNGPRDGVGTMSGVVWCGR
jgi:hypothetical protein